MYHFVRFQLFPKKTVFKFAVWHGRGLHAQTPGPGPGGKGQVETPQFKEEIPGKRCLYPERARLRP